MHKYFIYVLLFAISLNFQCQTKKRPDKLDIGKIENGIYRNQYFDMTVKIPANWKSLSRAEISELNNKGRDYISQGNSDLNEAIKEAEVTTVTLFSIFKYKLGTPTDFNSNMSLIVDNVAKFPHIKIGKDYLEETKKVLSQTQVQVSKMEIHDEKIEIGGKDFYRMDLTMSMMGFDVNQSYFATKDDKFVLGFILSYGNEEDKKLLENTVMSTKFGG